VTRKVNTIETANINIGRLTTLFLLSHSSFSYTLFIRCCAAAETFNKTIKCH